METAESPTVQSIESFRACQGESSRVGEEGVGEGRKAKRKSDVIDEDEQRERTKVVHATVAVSSVQSVGSD